MTYFVYGLARDVAHARTIIQALSAAGVIISDQVSVLSANRRTSGDVATPQHAQVARGAFAGGNVGGSIGWLAGLGSLAIPGLGLLVAAGPILGFLTGIAVGATIGNMRGAMIEEMGIPDEAVPRYEEAMDEGQIVISAKCEDSVLSTRALDAMRHTGAEAIGSTLGGAPFP
jgi:hypothetical protein